MTAATQPGLDRVVYTSAGKAGHTALRSSYAGHSSKKCFRSSILMQRGQKQAGVAAGSWWSGVRTVCGGGGMEGGQRCWPGCGVQCLAGKLALTKADVLE
jgi:hypothetical protein